MLLKTVADNGDILLNPSDKEKEVLLERTKGEEAVDTDKEIILEQWKTCVEVVESVSRRRDTLNNLFITLNLAICAVTSFKYGQCPDGQNAALNLAMSDIFRYGLPAAGIFFCGVWWFFLRSYKQLNSAKFEIIDDLESKLPMHPYRDEWKKLNKKYIRFTKLMQILPVVFIGLYTLYILALFSL